MSSHIRGYPQAVCYVHLFPVCDLAYRFFYLGLRGCKPDPLLKCHKADYLSVLHGLVSKIVARPDISHYLVCDFVSVGQVLKGEPDYFRHIIIRNLKKFHFVSLRSVLVL